MGRARSTLALAATLAATTALLAAATPSPGAASPVAASGRQELSQPAAGPAGRCEPRPEGRGGDNPTCTARYWRHQYRLGNLGHTRRPHYPAAVRRGLHRAWDRAHARGAVVGRDYGDWYAQHVASTDCVAIHSRAGCVRQAQIDAQDCWACVTKWALHCGGDVWVATKAAKNPWAVGGTAIGLCLFHAAVDLW